MIARSIFFDWSDIPNVIHGDETRVWSFRSRVLMQQHA